MRHQERLTAKQIRAATVAISHAEADAQAGGSWDRERSAKLELGCQVLQRLLNEATSKAQTMPKPSSDMLAALKTAAAAIDYGQAQVDSESDRKFLVSQLRSVKKSIRILEREYEDHRSR